MLTKFVLISEILLHFNTNAHKGGLSKKSRSNLPLFVPPRCKN